ncbi:hypothetical protein VE01_10752 [Pseudogymnoascus verrucosus]|uniref:Uncharacterized protein n=1 Tax=Pseudogymnoascus verrucosus TaxID=342668 RepID=A0A2P6FGT6_9PEZI|nr:uncharacterized protein VE01_10752 [Pseudogymnoascus verrucosus]PQM43856.1 hypothetical protein VE01_10752 [Pseudogymnoascus verrucosus]
MTGRSSTTNFLHVSHQRRPPTPNLARTRVSLTPISVRALLRTVPAPVSTPPPHIPSVHPSTHCNTLAPLSSPPQNRQPHRSPRQPPPLTPSLPPPTPPSNQPPHLLFPIPSQSDRQPRPQLRRKCPTTAPQTFHFRHRQDLAQYYLCAFDRVYGVKVQKGVAS